LSAPCKTIVSIDFETRWDKRDYTLSKLTTEEYIRDKRFKAFGACVHEYGSDTVVQWYNGDELPRILATYDWSKTAVLAHNAQFDVSILEWRYGVHPCFIFDTLSMARALRGVEVGNSLAKLAADFGLPEKGRAVHSTDGLDEIDAQIEKELADYCKHDVFLCEQIFERLVTGYPKSELRLIDMTLKMYTRPVLQLDRSMLIEALAEEGKHREGLLAKLGVEESELASNPKFAVLLESLGVVAPTKVSKTTGKDTLALAKNDAMFQALLNGDNEDVSLLCEARLKVKSTTERTRAQRFLDISQRGPLPVPLSYYGAKSGRWTAAKGSAINMQNLKRGSFLRKAIMAPQGHQLLVGDLSQIEPRVLAWLSDYDELLDIFRSGQDAYAQFGAQMFGIPGMTKDSHPDLRQSAKSALLGCFGSQTPVLTKRGWVTILEVTREDELWDGTEWVTHQGLVPQGEKEVLTAMGVSATSDHEILTEHGWAAWSAVLANPSRFQSALSLASLPACVGNDRGICTTPSCGVAADGKASCSDLTSRKGPAHVAENARSKQPYKRATTQKDTTTLAQTLSTATGYLTASAQSSCDVPTLKVAHTQITVGGALRSMLRGLKTAWSSCATSSVWMGGTYQSYNLTGLTTTGGTSRATFASSHAASTCPTNGKSQPEKLSSSSKESQPLKQRMQTYDIAYAGPRNRYTILTDAGPLVVHNCGYGLGWASFASQLLVGFLGAPPVRYDKGFAKKLDVTSEYIERFIGWEDNVKKLQEIPHTCTERELLVHCVAAKKIIDIYRATAHPVVSFWDMCDRLLTKSLAGGEEVVYKCLTFRKNEIVLPNGMSLLYSNLRQVTDKETKQKSWVYGEDETKLYAGKITNNVTQALARIVMTDGMLRTSKKYFVAGTVHDEQIVVVPDEEVDAAKTWVLAQMTVEPKYMPGVPLAVEGGAHRRYGLAKK
jgi:hypothetical protein